MSSSSKVGEFQPNTKYLFWTSGEKDYDDPRNAEIPRKTSG